jgi:hypothetical protein
MPVNDDFERLPVLQRDDDRLLSMAFIGMGHRDRFATVAIFSKLRKQSYNPLSMLRGNGVMRGVLFYVICMVASISVATVLRAQTAVTEGHDGGGSYSSPTIQQNKNCDRNEASKCQSKYWEFVNGCKATGMLLTDCREHARDDYGFCKEMAGCR